MATPPTPNYGWPFPTSSSTVDVPRDIAALAGAIDTSLKAIDVRATDSGNKDVVACALQSGFGSPYFSGRRFGPLCVLHWQATRTGAAIAAVASGNITDVNVFQITEPTMLVKYNCGHGFGNLGGGPGRCNLNASNNMLVLTNYSPGVAINTSDILFGTLVYIGT